MCKRANIPPHCYKYCIRLVVGGLLREYPPTISEGFSIFASKDFEHARRNIRSQLARLCRARDRLTS